MHSSIQWLSKCCVLLKTWSDHKLILKCSLNKEWPPSITDHNYNSTSFFILYGEAHYTLIGFRKIVNFSTFLLMSDIIPIRVRTCCLERPSRGTPSAKASAFSGIGSHKWRINIATYALNTFSGLARKSRTNLHEYKEIKLSTSIIKVLCL